MSENIFQKISQIAPILVEEDIDEWLIPQLATHYDQILGTIAYKAYGYACPKVAVDAFKERAKAEMKSALITYLFKAEHWKSGRDLNTYLLSVFYRLKNKIHWEVDCSKKTNVPICPGCKHLQKTEYLVVDSDLLRCKECSVQLSALEQTIKREKNHSTIMILEGRKKLFSSFYLHSKKGYKCPDCSEFIPHSCKTEYGIACPYPGCNFFGKIEELEPMVHPQKLSKHFDYSLQASAFKDSDDTEIQDYIKDDAVSGLDIISINESFDNDKKLLLSVLNEQIDSVKRTNVPGTILQKTLMYEAYINMVNNHPEDMINYLIRGKKCEDYPIQSRIFQEYVSLVQNALPYTLTRGGQKYEINSLLDPNITLFEGISSFDAIVRTNKTIPNNTKEEYIGGRKFKSYGPCFIGTIIDVTDKKTGLSIKNKIKKYSFVDVEFDDVEVGLPVTVKHYRIPSHYEMGSLVYLQRSRKRIVSSIQRKLNNFRNM